MKIWFQCIILKVLHSGVKELKGMNIEVNDLVEIQDTGVRLYVNHVVDDMCHLALQPSTTPVSIKPINELRKIPTTKFVWLNINDGTFSNSWELDDHITRKYMDELLQNTTRNDGIKLIEFNCVNDDTFEFNNLMKIG